MLKEFKKLPYRKCVSAVVMKGSKFLIVQNKSYKNNEWKFLSGGVKRNETKEKTLFRELKEELGTRNFEIVFKSKYKSVYNWPDEIIKRRHSRFKGQSQTIFFVKFLGKFSDIEIDEGELKDHKWVREDQLRHYLIFPNQYKRFWRIIDEYNKLKKQ
ncbi:NUDIX domain-containing protein [Candidatus Woesearchaeota archaeon]|nr:NUDIX domain-containing protein [Candidatus Woesearchaeota archaeon]